MVRLSKSMVGKVYKFMWCDPTSWLAMSLKVCKQQGMAKKESVGWLVEYNKRDSWWCSERCWTDDDGDYTTIPVANLLEVEEL